MRSKTCPGQSGSVCVLVSEILSPSSKALVIHLHPIDVCECPAVHFVNKQAALQVVHLVLDDAGCPPARLPRHLFSIGVQPAFWRLGTPARAPRWAVPRPPPLALPPGRLGARDPGVAPRREALVLEL